MRAFFPIIFLVLFALPMAGHAAAPTTQSRLDAAVKAMADLEKDKNRSGRRDLWEGVIKRFDPVVASSRDGDLAIRGRFQQAKAWEGLARRSFLKEDWKKAAELFGSVYARSPKHSLAEEALYRQAEVFGRRLADTAGAKKVLETRHKAFPKGKFTNQAEVLRKDLGIAAFPAAVSPAKPAAPPKPAGTAAKPAPVKGDPAAADKLYQDAVAEWKKLLGDTRKAGLRDSWLQMEKRFQAALDKDPSGPTAPKALYQSARCLEELAIRSHRKEDWNDAAERYLTLSERFPKHSLADDGLFKAATIQRDKLARPDLARNSAQRILDQYPKGDMVAEAKKLLADLPKTPAPPADESGSTTASVAIPAGSPSSANAASATAGVIANAASGVRAELAAYRHQAKDGVATFSAELTAGTNFTYRYAAASKDAPARLLVELESSRPSVSIKDSTSWSGSPISRVRVTRPTQTSTRLTLDLAKPRQFTVSTLSDPPRVVVRISQKSGLAGGIEVAKAGGTRKGTFPPSSGSKPGQGSLVEQLGLTVRTIMIDPGHGGKDPGAMGNGIKESNMTLKIARMVGERLQKQGFTVIYTRTGNKYVGLEERTKLANDKKADLFVSLHINAHKDAAVNGLETYFLDLARTNSAAQVAARENAVSVKSISDLQYILTDLMLSSKLEESRDLARIVHSQMTGRVKKAGFASRDNGVRSAPFYVLMGARMPAILVEMGYLSHKDDAKRLANQKFQERIAEGIVEGVSAYKKKLDGFAMR